MRRLVSTKGKKVKPAPDYGKIAARLVVAVAIVVLIMLNIFTYLLSVVSYYGDSMEPELESGQTLVVAQTQNVEEGDIVAFYYNNKVIVRRVICTGGKQISIADDGGVSINGVALTEDYVTNATVGQCNIDFPYSVPIGHVFVMGDNREIAMDSRLQAIGTISLDRIIGKVILSF